MNPTEIYQFITGLIRSGAEVIAAALVALGVGGFAGWMFRGWMDAKEIESLRKERDDARGWLLTEKEVANRVHTHGGIIVRNQWAVWEALPTLAAHYWGQSVHRFETMIVQSAACGRASKVLLNDTETAVAIWEDNTAKTLFSNLTDEIEKRIKDEAPHLAAVHS